MSFRDSDRRRSRSRSPPSRDRRHDDRSNDRDKYGGRGARDGHNGDRYGGGGGGSGYDRGNASGGPRPYIRSSAEIENLERRLAERNRTWDVELKGFWSRSPTPPPVKPVGRDPSYDSSDDDRQKRKHSKKEKKEKKSKKHKKHKKHHDSRSRSPDSGSDSEASVLELGADAEDLWVEKKTNADNSDAVVGPLPMLTKTQTLEVKGEFGKALLPGEGAAMAAFVDSGERIPRRGEIGLTSNEISKFEEAGFVMSGSRHRRMEAVRLRKENQVYSADDRRSLAMLNHQQRAQKEAKTLAEFREQLRKNLGKDSGSAE